MIPVTTFAGRQVAVFGLGGSGLVSCRALQAGGAEVIAWDDNPRSVAAAAAEGVPTTDLRGIDWAHVAALVLAPGVPLTHPAPHWSAALARGAGIEVIGDVELYCRERRATAPGSPFVAITGTNGKSTTTALTAHLLAAAGRDAAVGGNIGTAILSLAPPRPDRFHVIECSSFQIDLAPSLDPSVGILLNLSEDHLDRHGTFENYAAVKERLPAGVPIGGVAIVGVDDPASEAISERLEAAGKRLVPISALHPVRDGVYAVGEEILAAPGGKVHPLASLSGIGSLRGAHNAQNAAAACAAALACGLDPPDIQAGLRSFPGLAHRMEEVGRRGPVLFINDSKATNADAAARALASFTDIFWIAGGKPKAGGVAGLTALFPRVRKAYLIGEAAQDFARTLDGSVPYETAQTLDRAVALAARDAAASGLVQPVVLLSPACASYDQFPNFEVRGAAFREAVAALPRF